MFDSLSDRLQDIFAKLRGHGRLSEAQVDAALREVRLALLEADVNFRVVKDFVGRVRERAVGEEVTRSLTPAQQVIKIVHEELIATLGGETLRITYAPKPPTVVLSSLWLGAAAAAEVPVLALLEPEVLKPARRALRKAGQSGQRLSVVLAGEALPLQRGRAGSIVIENLMEIDAAETVGYLGRLLAALRPDGVIVALDRTKDPALEARLAGAFLAAGLTGIAQERPREGALLTVGGAPSIAVQRAIAERVVVP